MSNEDNVRIFGSEDDGVYIAPVGTVVVETLDPLGAAYRGVGLLGEDGIEEERESEVAEVRVHQGFRIARSKVTGTKHTFKVIASEWNRVVRDLISPASVTTTTGGVNVTRGIEKTKRAEYQVAINTNDDDKKFRKIHTRAEVTEVGTISKKANEATLYELTFTSYGEIIELDNDPEMAAEA